MDNLLSQFLSLSDIKRMGISTDCGFFVGSQFFINIIPKKYFRKALMAEFIDEIRTRLCEQFPICSEIVDHFNIEEITVLLSTQEDNSFDFTYNYKEILSWFFSYFMASYPKVFSEYAQFVEKKLSNLAIEDSEFEAGVQEIFMDIFRKINALLVANTDKLSESERAKIVKDRRIAKYFSKHINELFDILKRPITVDFPEDFNKDRFLLALNHKALFDLQNVDQSLEQRKKHINFIERYLTITDYFIQKENCSYNAHYIVDVGFIYSYSDLKRDYQSFCEKNQELVSSSREKMEMDQIFRQYLLDARKKMKREEFVKTIQLNFQFFPKGIGDHREGASKHSKVDEDLRKLLREKHNKMLQDKINFYSSTDYLWTLEEEQAFSGYRGYIYPNGKVVFDKFYNVTREGLSPAFNEAIITMDLVDFIEMAPQSKTELLELIRNHNARSVQRVYHTPGWETRVQRIISKEVLDYDFCFIENLLVDISKEDAKVYGKSNS